jgi:hypothetical protein
MIILMPTIGIKMSQQYYSAPSLPANPEETTPSIEEDDDTCLIKIGQNFISTTFKLYLFGGGIYGYSRVTIPYRTNVPAEMIPVNEYWHDTVIKTFLWPKYVYPHFYKDYFPMSGYMTALVIGASVFLGVTGLGYYNNLTSQERQKLWNRLRSGIIKVLTMS